jgi:predicted acyltransferase (DUF342 family)
MSTNSAVLALIALTGVLLVLPLLPLVIEVCRSSDVRPLNVIQQHAGEVGYFANSFRSYINAIRPELDRCAETGATAKGRMPDGAEYLVLGRGEDALMLPLRRPDGSCPVFLASSTTLLLPPNLSFARDIYANGRFIGAVNNSYRAVLAEQEVHLAAGSRVMRWIHAGGEFIADPLCQLFGRVTSDRSIRLSHRSRFVRLNAPRIEIGPPPPAKSAASPLERTVNLPPQRFLHHGDFSIPAGEIFRGDLVVRGRLSIGKGARVYGSVKCEKDMLIEAGAAVAGSVITERRMRIGSNCNLHGPVIAERSLFIAKGTSCGTAAEPTTVSAPEIAVENGVIVFGTLWAREDGKVLEKS